MLTFVSQWLHRSTYSLLHPLKMATVDELLTKSFLSRVLEQQCKIVLAGKPLPTLGPEGDVAHFAPLKYIQVHWLTGCKKRGKLFCWPCLLFNASTPLSTDGIVFSDFAKIESDHEKSSEHLQSVTKLTRFMDQHKIKEANCTKPCQPKEAKSSDTPKRLNYPSLEEQEYDALEAYAMLISYRLKNKVNAPFAKKVPCTESDLKRFHGNDLYMFGCLEDAMKLHSGVFRDVVSLHKDMLKACAQVVKNAIKAEVRGSYFVSLIFDDKSEEVENCHLATYLRFAHLDTGKLIERFIGFYDLSCDVKKRTGDILFEYFIEVVQHYELADKLVSVTVDGMAVDNVQLQKFMDKVHEVYPRVLYSDFGKLTRLMWGRLRHVSTEAQIFLGILSKINRFVAKYRQDILHADMNEPWLDKLFPNGVCGKYNSRNLTEMCTLLRLVRIELLNFFRNYSFAIYVQREGDYDRKYETAAYWRFLKDFGSILLAPFLEHYLKLLGSLNTQLIDKFGNGDWAECERLIEEFMRNLVKFKAENFEHFYSEALSIKRSADQVRLNRCNKHMHVEDDMDEDQLDDPYGEIQFEFDWVTSKQLNFESSNVKKHYSEMLDHLVDSIRDMTRKCHLDTMAAVKFFTLFNPTRVASFRESFPDELLENLNTTFPGLFNLTHLKLELQFLYKENNVSSASVTDLFTFLTLYNNLDEAFPQTIRLASLILAMPCRLMMPPIEPHISSRQNLLWLYSSKIFKHVRIEAEGYLRIESHLFDDLCSESKSFSEAIQAFYALRGIDITQYKLTEMF